MLMKSGGRTRDSGRKSKEKDCLDSPQRRSVWFTMTIVPLFCLLATCALSATLSMLAVGKLSDFSRLIQEMSDVQKNTLMDVQLSKRKQADAVDSFSKTLKIDGGKVLKELQDSRLSEEAVLRLVDSEITKNLMEIQNTNDNIQLSISELAQFTTNALNENEEGFSTVETSTHQSDLNILQSILNTLKRIDRYLYIYERDVEYANEIIDEAVTVFHAKEPQVIRLSGGAKQGIVELYQDGAWGTICPNGWDDNDGTVVCKMLGFTQALSTASVDIVARTNYFMEDVGCLGDELSIWLCPYLTMQNRYSGCRPAKVAYVTCA